MISQVLTKHARTFGSRLLATPIGTKPTLDTDQYVLPSGDVDFSSPEPLSHVSFGSFDAFDAGDACDRRPRQSNLDNAADLPIIWPMHSVFNGPSGGGALPWTNMKLHQAPVAPYHPASAPSQSQNGFADTKLMPVFMPVLCQVWGMQAPMTAQQVVGATTFAVEAAEVAPPCDIQLFFDGVSPAEGQEEDVHHRTGTADSGARRHRRSRRGGAAMRKQAAAAVCPEEPEVSDRMPTQEAVLHSITSQKRATRWADVALDEEGSLSGKEDDKQSQEPALLQSPTSGMSSTEASSFGAGSNETVDVDPVLLELDDADEAKRQVTLDWVLGSFWPLALTKRGCRIVQKAIDVGSPAYQLQLVENLHGRVHEAMRSPHTNYVLQKCITSMPPEPLQFVVAELQGQALYFARHRFGCRIIQRLIEHCQPCQTEQLIDEVLVDTAALCRHQYGNFVIQHILQHGSASQRKAIAEVIGTDIIRLAKHRIASHVVSSAMVHCPAEDVQRLTHAVLHDAGQLADLSRREYGSFVVREVNRAAKLMRA
jgi:hypothetical protein